MKISRTWGCSCYIHIVQGPCSCWVCMDTLSFAFWQVGHEIGQNVSGLARTWETDNRDRVRDEGGSQAQGWPEKAGLGELRGAGFYCSPIHSGRRTYNPQPFQPKAVGKLPIRGETR